jgi:hypothetical protein
MLFMVIEHFKNADPKPIGERFNHIGRMLPDGLTYHASWVDVTGTRCFQVMEAWTKTASRDARRVVMTTYLYRMAGYSIRTSLTVKGFATGPLRSR